MLNRIFSAVPPFVWPLPVAFLLWLVVRWTGHETRAFDTALFWGMCGLAVAILLIWIVRSGRRSLNDKQAGGR